MKRLLRFLLGAALLPLTAATVAAFFVTLYELPGLARGSAWLLGGMAAYTAVAVLLPRPVRLYILGHELTHALWSKLFGGRIGKLKITKQGGSVQVSVVNTLVILAPYFFPLYTIALGAAFALAALVRPMQPYFPVFLFLLGASLQFHYLQTGETLGQSQPDLIRAGVTLSLALIPLLNLLVLAAILQAVFPELPILLPWLRTAAHYTVGAYRELGLAALAVAGRLRALGGAAG